MAEEIRGVVSGPMTPSQGGLTSWQGLGPPVHFVFRFLQASHAAEMRALLVFFREVGGFEG
jgi:hypothetical protein